MRTRQSNWWPLTAAGMTFFMLFCTWAVAGQQPSSKHKAENAALRDALKDAINRGADLYDFNRDAAGCAALYEGALITIRPLLRHHPKLQKKVDEALAEAKATPNPVQRAFRLNEVLRDIRKALAGEQLGPPTEKKKGPTEIEKKKIEKKGPPTEKATLWQRLGGKEGVRKVVDEFVQETAADRRVDFTRGGKYKVDVPKLKKDLVDFISQVTGGPYRYTGPDMRTAHKGMHITNREFDLTVGHLKKALKDNNVPADAAHDFLKLVESTRKQIVSPAEQKKKEKTPGGTTGKKIIKGTEKEIIRPAGEKASVAGCVTYKGKPLPSGVINFVSATIYSARINKDGTYELPMIPAGKYKVSIVTNVAVPAQFARPETSGLTVTLRKGRNTCDINLQ
jgi:hemoglobin